VSAPRRLRVPFRLQLLYSSRRFFTGFSLVMGAFLLYGPIPLDRADHNAYRYLFGPLVSAALGLAIALLFPYNPYRPNRFGDRSLSHLDDRDPDARRFLEILRTPEHRRRAVLTAAIYAVVESVVLATIALGFRSSLDWHLRSPWLITSMGGGVFFAWLFIKVQTISWALDTWWSENGRDPDAGGGG
jgi:hypothetical protein